MLQMHNISKEYRTGELVQKALDKVSLCFRDCEFVSILGPSGSGKTTLLNIVGGLDRYDSGDLIINSVSTKEYRDGDWDSYRNHTIGFVFQSYNLIPHQSILSNVELALTISGVSKSERRKRAKAALTEVGLGDQMHKRPNQISGGQMQRVAIARALVNNPDILLADEPTGALDSETSRQVMELLKQVSHDRLVIMVTHNSELAEAYSTRIVRLRDGRIVDDSNPFTPNSKVQPPVKEKRGVKKTSMSFFTALSLSTNNLRTKKGRTLLTSFAGSIGIIGIALILALSTGIQNYVNAIQRDTLASYPISIEREQSNFFGILAASRRDRGDFAEGDKTREADTVYSNPRMYDLFNAMFSESEDVNNLRLFKEFLEKEMTENISETKLFEHVSTIQYQYDVTLNTYVKGSDDQYHGTELSNAFTSSDNTSGSISMFTMMGARMTGMSIWNEMLPGDDGQLISDLILEQYDLVYGEWPASANEIVLILDSNNEITDVAFYALGLMEYDEVESIFSSVLKGEQVEVVERSIKYDDVLNTSFKLILNTDYYKKSVDGSWSYIGDDSSAMDMIINGGYDLRISGIIRPNPDATAASLSGSFGYTSELTKYVIEKTNESELVRAQLDPENENLDLLTGLPFVITDEVDPTDSYKAERIMEYFSGLNEMQKAEVYTKILATPDAEYLEGMVSAFLAEYPTREDMIAFAAESYGFDIDVTSEYLASYSDEELKNLMREQITNLVCLQYEEQAEAQIAQIKASAYDPSDLFGVKGYAAIAAAFDTHVASITDEAVLADYYDKYMPATVSGSTLAENLETLGAIDIGSPSVINIYANTFEDKEAIAEIISDYNSNAAEEDVIEYTDYVALLMWGVTTMINAVSYGLIAFVAISLVVSSIMIGIITYISVLERTKEIGVLRSIGASKNDISSVFIAETLIVGFCAGAIGIGVSLLLCIPLNLIIHSLTGITTINALLRPDAAIILVLISMFLTLIAGLIPSRMAAKKDPVTALRTE
ncbi:MAG: ABC transporter ATP-binding protein/permease [Christensenellaceae bacterium]|nr:ABC transporter ATP-binding protein/permease [Christensenellaceae bacterium]